jgi:hypothetical protein
VGSEWTIGRTDVGFRSGFSWLRIWTWGQLFWTKLSNRLVKSSFPSVLMLGFSSKTSTFKYSTELFIQDSMFSAFSLFILLQVLIPYLQKAC